MIDLNLKLSFQKEPYDHIRYHTIFPLSSEGLKEYHSKDHITHKFVSKFHPKIMEYVNLMSKDEEEIFQNKNEDKNKSVKFNMNNQSTGKTNFQNFKSNKTNSNNKNLFSQQDVNKKLPKKLNYSNLSNINSNTTLLNNKLKNRHNKFNKYDGFVSYNVPRLNSAYLPNNSERNNTERLPVSKGQNSFINMEHTLNVNSKNLNRNYSQKNYDIEDKEINLYNNIIKENEKMENIFLMQTNPQILNKFHLPKISQNKNNNLLIQNMKGSSKEIGGNFNPIFNYMK
jgi:hypothetical protein